MKKGKRIIAGILGLALTASLVACGKKDNTGDYKIGIAQFAEHPSLDNCAEGFQTGLTEELKKQGKTPVFVKQNAAGDGGMAAQIMDNMVTNKVDLVCSITTPMSQIAYSKIKDGSIPIIFTAITDPIAVELAKEDGSPVGEITGSSDRLPVKKQLEMIKALMPKAKKIGIMYSTSEVNSEVSVKEYKKLAADFGFEIVEQAVSASSDVPLATDSILTKVDCLNNITDNTVVSNLDLILEKAKKAGKPVFGSEVEQVKKGCVASVGLDYVALGVETGKMAAKVLLGEKKASEMNFITIEDAKFYGNKKAAEAFGISFSDELLANGEMVE